MSNKMSAEICFYDQDALSSATPALIENGFEITTLDWVDDEDSAIWIVASSLTELDQDGFLDQVSDIVNPFRCSVIEAGLGWNPAWGERRNETHEETKQ